MVWILAAIVVAVAVLVTVYLNVIASIALWRIDDLDRLQKAGQAALVWLVPVFGALFVLCLLVDHDELAVPRRWAPDHKVYDYFRAATGIDGRTGGAPRGRGREEDTTDGSPGAGE